MDWSVFIHSFKDIFIYLPSWILSELQTFFSNIFLPLSWFFNLLKGFFSGLSSVPSITTLSWGFTDNVITFFNTIPYWNYLMFGVASALSILILVFLFRRFSDF